MGDLALLTWQHVDLESKELRFFMRKTGRPVVVPMATPLDPWRNCVRDSTEKEYSEALARLREVMASVPKRPAVLMLHHIRKPTRHRNM